MKTTILAALVAMTVAGCGAGEADARRADQAAAASAYPSADAWAEQAFGIYGEDAVRTCLAGFHAQSVGAAGNAADYRAELAQYMCACARGQSQQQCPQP
jgi:hypothetical protein